MSYFANNGIFNTVYNGTSTNTIYDGGYDYLPQLNGTSGQYLTYKNSGNGLYWTNPPKSDASHSLLEIIKDICSD